MCSNSQFICIRRPARTCVLPVPRGPDPPSLASAGYSLGKAISDSFPKEGPIKVLVGISAPGQNWSESLAVPGRVQGGPSRPPSLMGADRQRNGPCGHVRSCRRLSKCASRHHRLLRHRLLVRWRCAVAAGSRCCTRQGPSWRLRSGALRLQAEAAQAEALADWNSSVSVTEAIGDGETLKAAMDSLPWQDQELMTVGSSGLGSLLRAFLGSNLHKIVRTAPIPCIVLPRQGESDFAA